MLTRPPPKFHGTRDILLRGARKMWARLRGKGHDVARCTIERLMREMGISGVTRPKMPRTTIADEKAKRPQDLGRPAVRREQVQRAVVRGLHLMGGRGVFRHARW